jgi:AraC-like DNA-binding protein
MVNMKACERCLPVAATVAILRCCGQVGRLLADVLTEGLLRRIISTHMPEPFSAPPPSTRDSSEDLRRLLGQPAPVADWVLDCGTRLVQALAAEASSVDPASRLFVEQAVDLLCTRLIRSHSSCGGTLAVAQRRGLADWQRKRVVDYMEDHIDQAIGLEELAALVRLGRFHFCTAFRLATGLAPHAYLTELRILRARTLLKEPGARIGDVALAVGYQTASAFAASFRKLVGTTPSAYRHGQGLLPAGR